MTPNLLGVKLPKTKKTELLKTIAEIPKNDKKKLFFLYSEFFLRANRNPFYKHTLNQADLLAVDGKGSLWHIEQILQPRILPNFYAEKVVNWPWVFRMPIFILLFLIQFLVNCAKMSSEITSRQDFLETTGNDLILGRDFVYDLLNLAEVKGWKVVAVGGSNQQKDAVLQAVQQKFPKLDFHHWSRDFRSDLMKDKAVKLNFANKIANSEDNFLVSKKIQSRENNETNFIQKHKRNIDFDGYIESPTCQNICELFPDLKDAKKFISKQNPDIILVCLGGSSGKQEFFIENLKMDNSVSFRLATGIGAALDHLGGGAKQKLAPKWMIKFGLEWLFRFINQPYRRMRIVDSIFSFVWWMSLQQFMQKLQNRPTTINILFNEQNQLLLAKRHNSWITGDLGWAWFQGGIEKSERNLYSFDFSGLNPDEKNLIMGGIRELTEETDIKCSQLKILSRPIFSGYETMSISLLRSLYQGCKYYRQKKYLNLLSYTGKSRKIKTNWENTESGWFDVERAKKFLVPEKWTDLEKIKIGLK